MQFANILTTNYMAATYQGLLVVKDYGSGPMSCPMTQDDVDTKIAAGAEWGSLLFTSGMPISILKHEDGQPVLEADTISYENVPTNAELFITSEIAYYIQS